VPCARKGARRTLVQATGLGAEEFAAARRTMNVLRDRLIEHAQGVQAAR
jgi:hypothetical protein